MHAHCDAPRPIAAHVCQRGSLNIMGKYRSKRTAKYKLKVKQQKRISHSKSRLRSALAKTAIDFQREKEEQKEQIKLLSK